MIDHLGLEVADLQRSARFYDAVLWALGARRIVNTSHAIAYGVTDPVLWIAARGRPPGAGGTGFHVALRASGRAAVDAAHAAGLASGGADDGAPGPRGGRAGYGTRTYAGYLRDPDALRVEIVAR